uniref:Uncharacterized protein n=1 Tax=Spongospora subterranea TaxID=70186 RepID=A0A0H5RPN4_9EUKA|eukprot:CRZ10684.1 hypothetical protein [Spongospora subterranea]
MLCPENLEVFNRPVAPICWYARDMIYATVKNRNVATPYFNWVEKEIWDEISSSIDHEYQVDLSGAGPGDGNCRVLLKMVDRRRPALALLGSPSRLIDKPWPDGARSKPVS